MKFLVEQHGLEACRAALRDCGDATQTETAPTVANKEPIPIPMPAAQTNGAISPATSGDSIVDAMLGASFDGILLVDGAGTIVRTNEAARGMFGYSEQQDSLAGQPLKSLIGGSHGARHDEYLSRFSTLSEQTQKAVLNSMRDVQGKRSDGTEFPVKIGIRMVRERNGDRSEDTNGNSAPKGHLFVAFCHNLSVNKEQLSKIEDNVALTEGILNASYDAAFVTNDEGVIQRVNDTAITMFGYDTRSDLLGKSISTIIGGPHARMHDKYFAKASGLSQEQFDALLSRMRDVTGKRKDGSEFPVQVGLKNLFVGNKCHFVAYIHDLTEVKKEMMVASSLLESSFDSTFLTNSQGIITRVNQTAVTMFGYDEKEDLVGHSIAKVIGGNYGKFHESMFSAPDSAVGSLTEGTLEKIVDHMRDVTGKRQDNSEFPVQVGLKLLDVHGERMYVAYCHDLTEHKMQVQRLEEEKQASDVERKINRSILDSSFDSIFLVEDDGTIIQVNASAVNEFGYDPEELIGQNISKLVGGGKAPHHDSYLKGFKNKNKKSRTLGTHNNEVLAKRKDGSEFPCQVGLRLVSTASTIQKIHNQGSDEEMSGLSDDESIASHSTSNTANTTKLLSNKMVGFVRNITAEQEAMALALEKKAAEALLTNMLPKEIAARLRENPSHIADHFAKATVLFADIVGFTRLSNSLEPVQVVQFLNNIFSRFDEKLEKYNLNKIKTIGDCYMATSIPGCRDPTQSCAAVCHFALDMIDQLEEYNKENPDQPLNMRIGMNCGPVVAGVVGTKRFLYDIWGDAVNVASRMESTGIPGRVQVTPSIVETVPDGEFEFEERGTVSVKGIGEMNTFLLKHRNELRSTAHWQRVRNSVVSGSFNAHAGANRSLSNLIHLASLEKIALTEAENEGDDAEEVKVDLAGDRDESML
mmetsp:Transcript_1852/g.5060  ORF Transcript_1852/g.5060 Transcript_1852/m.5060 type:complete len:922 (-) Transcript_1852:99-2864(-)